MSYYKVMVNDRIIDVLTQLIYVKCDKRHPGDIFVCDDASTAEGFLSADRSMVYREQGMPISVEEFDTVVLTEIDKFEYNQLKALTLKTPQEIIDAYTLSLVEGGYV